VFKDVSDVTFLIGYCAIFSRFCFSLLVDMLADFFSGIAVDGLFSGLVCFHDAVAFYVVFTCNFLM